MNDTMLYVMISMLIGLFSWAGFEYAKAGFDAWKEKHQPPTAKQRNSDEKDR